jgi:hypothetical protein
VEPVRDRDLSPGAVPAEFGSACGLRAVFPVVHTSYDYDEEIL